MKLCQSSLDIRPLGDDEAHLAEDRRNFIHALADRVDAAARFGPRRQGHVDAFGGELGIERRRVERRLARIERGLHLVAQRVERQTLGFARLGIERAQALHQLGDAAFFAERRNPRGLERCQIARVGDGLEQLGFQAFGLAHGALRLREAAA